MYPAIMKINPLKMNECNTFTVKGINMRGEVDMGLIMVIVTLVTIILGMSLIILTNSRYSFRNPPFYSILALLYIGLGLALITGKFIGKSLS
jgi:hypothetical protein